MGPGGKLRATSEKAVGKVQINIPDELIHKTAEMGLDAEAVRKAAVEGVKTALDDRDVEGLAKEMVLMLPTFGFGGVGRRQRHDAEARV